MPSQSKIDVNEFASLVTIYISILTVIYSDGNYDSWDLLIGGLIVFSVFRFKSELEKSKASKWFSRIALSIALTIMIFYLESLFSSPNENLMLPDCDALANKGFLNFLRISAYNLFGCREYETIDFEFIVALIIFIIMSIGLGGKYLLSKNS